MVVSSVEDYSVAHKPKVDGELPLSLFVSGERCMTGDKGDLRRLIAHMAKTALERRCRVRAQSLLHFLLSPFL